jgi:hypothetical protein
MTLPTTTTWGAVGCPRTIPYEAPQGRRLNVIGAYFSHGPQAGELRFASYASVPQRPSSKGTPRKSLAQLAAEHGLAEEDLGIIDSDVFLGFIWQLAGRPVDASAEWRRQRPLMVVVDNYSVHKSERVRWERLELKAADVHLVYLPAYSPELSRMEPHWKVTKYHGLPQRSYATLGDLKTAVDTALVQRALALRVAQAETSQSLARPP